MHSAHGPGRDLRRESGDRSEHSPFLSVVVPAYNEESRLGLSLSRILSYLAAQPFESEVVVVDDGSTDSTHLVVQELASTDGRVRLLSHHPNRGKGFAVRRGMLEARGSRILFSDADLSTPIEELSLLSAALDRGCDVAVGSRDVVGSELVRRQSLLRETGGRMFNRVVQWMAVPGIRDTQCGFKLFTRDAARRVFGRCVIDGFAFDVEALHVARNILGYTIAEVPVRWSHCEGSKVSVVRHGLIMLREVVRIRRTAYARMAVDERSLADVV